MDLRRRVWAAWKAGVGTQEEVAALFSVSVSFVARWVRLRRETGSVVPRPHRGGNPRALGPAALAALRAQVEAHPDLTLAEHRARLAEAGHPRIGLSTLWRTREALGLTRKKKRYAPANATPKPSSKRARPIGAG